MFAVLFALKYGLPYTGIGAGFQLLILLVVATGFAWFFWWNCSPDRRGVAFLVLSLWVVGLVKLIRLAD